MPVPRRPHRRRAGTFLVLVGIAGILTTTFVAGVWTGRNWPVLGGGVKPGPSVDPARGRVSADRLRPAGTLPSLTFYQELTAPLTAPPPPAKATKPRPPDLIKREPLVEARRDGATEAPPRVESAARSDTPSDAPAAADAPTAGAGFTVQVGAYNARPPADALRAMLAAAGHDARVIEAATPSGIRYRVQVGAFPTRQAAQDTAARLTAERSLSTFVTTR
jgi:cell division septation protein DedD